jgi:hypothetical protein
MAEDQSGAGGYRKDYSESPVRHIIEEDGGILGNGYSFARGDFRNNVGRSVGEEMLGTKRRVGKDPG